MRARGSLRRRTGPSPPRPGLGGAGAAASPASSPASSPPTLGRRGGRAGSEAADPAAALRPLPPALPAAPWPYSALNAFQELAAAARVEPFPVSGVCLGSLTPAGSPAAGPSAGTGAGCGLPEWFRGWKWGRGGARPCLFPGGPEWRITAGLSAPFSSPRCTCGRRCASNALPFIACSPKPSACFAIRSYKQPSQSSLQQPELAPLLQGDWWCIGIKSYLPSR